MGECTHGEIWTATPCSGLGWIGVTFTVKNPLAEVT